MKQLLHRTSLLLCFIIFVCSTLVAQQSSKQFAKQDQKETVMKTYLIERNIPGAGLLNAGDLKAISQKSCSVLKEMGPQIEWVHSYVSGDKILCVYRAANEELLREHAKRGGFPANSITEVANVISPATAGN